MRTLGIALIAVVGGGLAAACSSTGEENTESAVSPQVAQQAAAVDLTQLYCGLRPGTTGESDIGSGCYPLHCLEGCTSTWATTVCLQIQNGLQIAIDNPGIELTVIGAEVLNAIADAFPSLACGSGSQLATNANSSCTSDPNSADCLNQTAVGICLCGWGNNGSGAGPSMTVSRLCSGNMGALCSCLSQTLSTSSSYDPVGAMGQCRSNPRPLQACANGYTPSVLACSGGVPTSMSSIQSQCTTVVQQWYTSWISPTNYNACINACIWNTTTSQMANCPGGAVPAPVRVGM